MIGRIRSTMIGANSGALIYWRGVYDQIGWTDAEIARAVGLSPTIGDLVAGMTKRITDGAKRPSRSCGRATPGSRPFSVTPLRGGRGGREPRRTTHSNLWPEALDARSMRDGQDVIELVVHLRLGNAAKQPAHRAQPPAQPGVLEQGAAPAREDLVADRVHLHGLEPGCGELGGVNISRVDIGARHRERRTGNPEQQRLQWASPRIGIGPDRDRVGEHQAAARPQQTGRLGEKELAGIEMEGALDGGDHVATGVRQPCRGGRSFAQIDPLLQSKLSDASPRHPHLLGRDVDADDPTGGKAAGPVNVLFGEPEANVHDLIVAGDAGRPADQFDHRFAGVVDGPRLGPVAEVQVQPTLGETVGRRYPVQRANRQGRYCQTDAVAESRVSATPFLPPLPQIDQVNEQRNEEKG